VELAAGQEERRLADVRIDAASAETIPPRLIPVTPIWFWSTSDLWPSHPAARRTSSTPWRIDPTERSISGERNRLSPAGLRSP
jgi:hypothetical protein